MNSHFHDKLNILDIICKRQYQNKIIMISSCKDKPKVADITNIKLISTKMLSLPFHTGDINTRS